MLQKMRTGAQSILVKAVLFGLLLLAMTGLAFRDVQGMFSHGTLTGSSTIAKVDGQKISAAEFNAIYQRALRQQNIGNDEALRNAMPMIVLNQEINSRIYARAARDLGIVVDDKTAATALKNDVLAPIAKEAGISEKEALSRLLANLNLSERAFVESFKTQIAVDALLKALPGGASAPEQLVKDALKRRYEWRRGDYIELTAADLRDKIPAASEEDLKKHYQSVASSFLLPEYRSFDVLLIDRAGLGLNGKPDAAAVKAYYDEHSEDFAEPEQRAIEQIVAADEDVAKEMLDAARAGASLKDLAAKAKASGDARQAKTVFLTTKGKETDMEVTLAKAAFAVKKGEVAGPVQTPLGWHILKITEVKPAQTPPFEDVRARIEKDMAEDINAEALYKRASEIDDAVAGGASLAEVARQNKLKVFSFKNVTSEGLDKSGQKIKTTLPAFDKIVETAYDLDEGRTSQLTETSDGAMLLITTNTITKAQEQPFEAVRAEVAESLRLKKLGEAFDAKSADITEKLQLGRSLSEIAASLGKPVRSTGLVQRTLTQTESTPGLARGLLPALFAIETVGQSTTVNGEEKIIILRLAERKSEIPGKAKAADEKSVRTTLDRALRNDILEQYRNALLESYHVKINEELLSRMFTKKTDDEESNL